MGGANGSSTPRLYRTGLGSRGCRGVRRLDRNERRRDRPRRLRGARMSPVRGGSCHGRGWAPPRAPRGLWPVWPPESEREAQMTHGIRDLPQVRTPLVPQAVLRRMRSRRVRDARIRHRWRHAWALRSTKRAYSSSRRPARTATGVSGAQDQQYPPPYSGAPFSGLPVSRRPYPRPYPRPISGAVSGAPYPGAYGGTARARKRSA